MPQVSDPVATLAQALNAILGSQSVQKAVSSTPTFTYGHGPLGLFSQPGLSRDLFSAMVLPNAGLQAQLPVRASIESNPLYGIITGVTATTGSEPTGVCDDPPTAGLTKLCTRSVPFGRQSRQTPVIDVTRAGVVFNRGEFLDHQIFGGPNTNNPNVPTVPGADLSNVANREYSKALFELAVAWSRDFAKEVYTGNPSNNTAGGGREYFYGLEKLVNTGYQDAITEKACPAADSIVQSMGGLVIEDAGSTYVTRITSVYNRLRWLAARAGLTPVQWVAVMNYGTFYSLSSIWPCAYNTNGCSNIFSTSQTQFVDSRGIIEMRDGMRGDLYGNMGQYLLIDGQRVPVIIDDAIPEVEGGVGGTFSSDIYFLPMTVLGGRPVLFWEYLNYDAPGGALETAQRFAPSGSYYTTDGGRFLWFKKPPTNACVQLMAWTQPRLVLETPYLAARLSSVKYRPFEHERSAFTDSSYFVNGGNTSYPKQRYYPPTAS